MLITTLQWIGKPVDADNLRRIESIVNEQIKAELDVSAKEATLAEAKRINGLRAVFGEVSNVFSKFLLVLSCIIFLNILPWCRSILILLELCQLDKKLRIFLLTPRMKNGYLFHQNYVEVNIVANVSFEGLFFFIIRGSLF